MKLNWLKLLPITPILLLANPNILTVKQAFNKSDTDSNSICIQTNRYFSSTNGSIAKPFVRLIPNEQFGLSLSYDEICINGLRPRVEYTINIKKDIPLGNGKLSNDYSVTKTTNDYQSSISFDDSGYILPSKGDITIPLKTMNIKKVAVKLYRINQNNLMPNINNYNLFRKLEEYELSTIANSDGYKLDSGKLIIDTKPNIATTTAISINKLLKKRENGVYILSATEINSNGEEDEYSMSTQWFMISDIGVYTIEGTDGLRVYTRHLSDASTYSGIKLELRSTNNEVLETIVTKNGEAIFDKKLLGGKRGLAIKAIYAYGNNGDFTVLNLARSEHDLSDRGVDGRDSHGEIDAFIYSNRDIFRPSETVPIKILLRDSSGMAKAKQKISVKLYNPSKSLVASKLLTSDKSGYAHTNFAISESAPTGRWYVEVYYGDSTPIAKFKLIVEDFTPPKVTIKLLKKPDYLTPNTTKYIEIESKYLTGEPLANGKIEIDGIIHTSKNPSKKYNGYYFGDLENQFGSTASNTITAQTDENGIARIPIELDTTDDTTYLLSTHLSIAVSEPGGRPAKLNIELPYYTRDTYVGIKPHFKNSSCDIDTNPIFSILYLKNQKLSNEDLTYKIIEEDVHWHWISNDDTGWRYYKTYSDSKIIQKGSISVTNQHSVELKLDRLDWGQYRIEVEDGSGAVSNYRFGSGYEESASKSSPDRLPISIDKQSYRPDEKIRVNIKPKFTGPIMVSIASNKIWETKYIDAISNKDIELSFDIASSWGSSVYVLATAFRAGHKKLGASRAVGVAHISIKDPKREIKLKLNYPQRVKSKSNATISIHADNLASKSSYLTLSAVDEGVLSLTQYSTANPEHYFWGQKRLGIKIRDVYADLIKSIGSHGEFTVGAGEEIIPVIKSQIITNKRKVVAIFTPLLSFDSDGNAKYTISIPDYQGSLRIMAVAWNSDAVGSTEGNMIVKDPISTEIYMPNFLSVGDSATVTLRITSDQNISDGKYDIDIQTDNRSSLSTNHLSYTLDKSAHKVWSKELTLSGKDIGTSKISLKISHNSKVVASRDWEIGIRASYPTSYVRQIDRLKSQRRINYQNSIEQNQWSHINDIDLRISSKPLISYSSVEDALIAYGSRCAEQTVSRAMPWVDTSVTKQDEKKKTIIQKAILRLINQQKLSGGFDLWGSGDANTWVTSYVVDFLTRARASGYSVPYYNIRQGLRWLENNLDRWSKYRAKNEADCYALYVLAKSGKKLISEIEYHIEDREHKIKSAQAWGYLASTLAYLGEKERAKELFSTAIKAIGEYDNSFYSNYGGVLRDTASLIWLIDNSNLGLNTETIYSDLAITVKSRKYLSTQDMSTILIASKNKEADAKKLNLLVDNREYKGATQFQKEYSSIDELANVVNLSDKPIWYSMSFKAIPNPKKYNSSQNHGFDIQKSIYSFNNQKIDMANITQNSRLVVVITGKIKNINIKEPLITDWIPAGFEIENPTIDGVDATASLKWLGKRSSTKHTAYRNDRYISALEINDNNSSFKLAYTIRAVTKGSFTLPPSSIEDMYQPIYHAFSRFATQKLIIKSPNDISKQPQSTSYTGSGLSSQDYIDIYTKPIKNLDKFDITELYFLRTGILAKAGMDFSVINPMLHKRFLVFDWYRPTSSRSNIVYKSLNKIQKDNIAYLLDEEKMRGGGVMLSDIYRVHAKLATPRDLLRFNKSQLRVLKNSLYARYGLRFRDRQLESIFLNMSWYHPSDITADEILEDRMSDIERDNLYTIINQIKRR